MPTLDWFNRANAFTTAGKVPYVCFVRPIWVRYLGSCGWNSYPCAAEVIFLS